MTTPDKAPEKPPLEVAMEPAGDPVAAPVEAAAPAAPETPAEPAAPAAPVRERVQSDVDRASIAEKFAARRKATNEGLPFAGNVAPALNGGNLTAETPEPEPPAAAEAAPTPEGHPQGAPSDSKPRTVKLVVRREEREVDEAELTRLAQIGAANESYLGEARNILEEAKRVASSRPHPGDTAPAKAAETPANPDDQSHPTDPFEDAADKIQFGEKSEVAKALRDTTMSAATTAARRVALEDRFNGDLRLSTREYNEFAAANADLLKDPITEAGLERLFQNGLREDLIKVGVPAEKIPRNPDDLINAHRVLRIQGEPVRGTKDILAASKTTFESWKGGTPAPTPQPATQVVVQVNRDVRRASIPQQPSRAAAPPQASAPAPSAASTRSGAVSNMRRARGLITAG